MRQLVLAPDLQRPRKTNQTTDGELGCAFGTPWGDHVGAGPGCAACDEETTRDG
jgi:hypothetical protein